MATITRFEELEIWQEARRFAFEVFEAHSNSESFSQDSNLTDQIHTAIGLVMDNIAGGFERNGFTDFVPFLVMAIKSLAEVKSLLNKALSRNCISQHLFDQFYEQADELGKKIKGLISYLNEPDLIGSNFKRQAVLDSKS